MMWSLFAFTILVLLNHGVNIRAEAPIDTCTRDEQCTNGGLCEFLNEDGMVFRRCRCPEGFGGVRCERNCPLECENGGVCIASKKIEVAYLHGASHKDDYSCKCRGYFMGELCEVPYTNCGDGMRCFNGGQCPDKTQQDGTSTVCDCPEDRAGDYCQYRKSAENEIIPQSTHKHEEEEDQDENSNSLFAFSFCQHDLCSGLYFWVGVGIVGLFLLLMVIVFVRCTFRKKYSALGNNSDDTAPWGRQSTSSSGGDWKSRNLVRPRSEVHEIQRSGSNFKII